MLCPPVAYLGILAFLIGCPWIGRHGPILRGAGEHFDEVVVQRVVELALKIPGELRMIKVTRMDLKLVGVNRDGRVLQVDQDFNHSLILARRKREQGMVVEL